MCQSSILHLLMIQRYLAYVGIVSQQQRGVTFHGLALGPVVGILVVTRHTLALVCPSAVDADLTADARLQAFIDIWIMMG